MDAIVTAGGTPKEGEPLYEYSQGKPKALIDIAGKPMIQWVLDALDKSPSVDNIFIVGLEADTPIHSSKLIEFLPNHGGILENLRAGVLKALAVDPSSKHVLAVSSDIPAIKSEMVDWIVQESMKTDEDLYYFVIEKSVMETRFPGSNRSFTNFKDVSICGGDLNVIRTMTMTGNDELWEKIIAARKNVFKQASLIGYDILFQLLFKSIKLQDAVDKVKKRLGITGRVILSPYAEIGMDIDKPHQLEIIRADFEKQLSE